MNERTFSKVVRLDDPGEVLGAINKLRPRRVR